jgi:hypothetical protein
MPSPTCRFAGGAAALAAVIVSAATLVCADAVHAQASPYLTLDDPRLPLLEHLIARGDIPDPTPLVRPFRRVDATRALAAAAAAMTPADSAAPLTVSAALIRALHARLDPPAGAGENRWEAAARAGGQVFSHIRRDVLHPLGTDGARPYADFAAVATAGDIVVATRLAAEPRLPDDPEWPGRRELTLAWRAIDGYASAQFKYATLFYGQMERNWGPVGLPGIGLSNYAYPQVETGFTVGAGSFSLSAVARPLADEEDETGRTIHRYFFAHRVGIRVSDRLHLGLWETTVLSGADREFDGRYRNPFTLLLFTNQYGLGANGNVMLGVDAHWRVGRRTALQAQLGIDDLQYKNPTGDLRYPNRWALTVTAFGALGPSASWRALYTQASSLAFRTLDRFESFTDRGVGLGRNFADHDQLTMSLGLPVRTRWLLSPEVTLLRQGEGRIADPFPASADEAGELPSLFIGTMERTWRLALGAAGREGPLDLSANAGFHHVENAGHERGRTANRFEGRLQATLGFTTGGTFR